RSRHRRPIPTVRSRATRCASRTRPSPDEDVELLGSPRRTVVEVAVGQDLRFRGRETSDETAGAGEDAAGDPVGYLGDEIGVEGRDVLGPTRVQRAVDAELVEHAPPAELADLLLVLVTAGEPGPGARADHVGADP